MEIAYFILDPFPSDRATSIEIANTVNEIANQGATVHLFAPVAAPREELEQHFNLELSSRIYIQGLYPCAAMRQKYPSFSYRAWLLKKLWEMSRWGTIDFIYTRGIKLASFLRRFAVPLGFRIIYEVHQIEADWPYDSRFRAWKNNRRERRVFNGGLAGVVCITQALMNKLNILYPLNCPATVIPCGVQRKFLAEELRLRPRISRIIHVSSLTFLEGVDVLIRAMQWIDATLYIYTRTRSIQAFRDMVAALGLRSKVRFCGPLDHGLVPSVLQQADMLAIPLPGENPVSRNSSPLKLFEYMAAGKPIVASDVPGIREVLEDRRNALLFRASDPQSLAQAVHLLQNDPALARCIASNALADAQRYTWDERAKSILTFLEGIKSRS